MFDTFPSVRPYTIAGCALPSIGGRDRDEKMLNQVLIRGGWLD
jgi:hypothetical protein